MANESPPMTQVTIWTVAQSLAGLVASVGGILLCVLGITKVSGPLVSGPYEWLGNAIVFGAFAGILGCGYLGYVAKLSLCWAFANYYSVYELMKKTTSATRALQEFLSRFSMDVQLTAHAALKALKRSMPGAHQLVFDNYNALVIAFSPTTKTADCHISIAVYPRWVNLFFARGAGLPDPGKLLKGSGKAIRHVVLKSPKDIDQADVKKLVKAALVGHELLLDPASSAELTIKSVAKTQRPRKQ